MCVCIHTHKYIYVYVRLVICATGLVCSDCACMWVCWPVCIYFYVSVYTYKKDVAHETYVYIYKCIHIHIHIYKQMYKRTYIYIYIYECTHKYICTHILRGGCGSITFTEIYIEKKVQYFFCKRALCMSKRALIISQKDCTVTWLLRSAVFFFSLHSDSTASRSRRSRGREVPSWSQAVATCAERSLPTSHCRRWTPMARESMIRYVRTYIRIHIFLLPTRTVENQRRWLACVFTFKAALFCEKGAVFRAFLRSRCLLV